MGLDIYLSKKTFIGAMFDSTRITGIICLYKHGKQIPIQFGRVSYVTEDIYHGHKLYWLLEWLNRELPELLLNGEEREIDNALMDRLHQACKEVLAHRDMPDFREVCKEKLHCDLKPDISEEELEFFLDELKELVRATDPSEKTDDAAFVVSASW